MSMFVKALACLCLMSQVQYVLADESTTETGVAATKIDCSTVGSFNFGSTSHPIQNCTGKETQVSMSGIAGTYGTGAQAGFSYSTFRRKFSDGFTSLGHDNTTTDTNLSLGIIGSGDGNFRPLFNAGFEATFRGSSGTKISDHGAAFVFGSPNLLKSDGKFVSFGLNPALAGFGYFFEKDSRLLIQPKIGGVHDLDAGSTRLTLGGEVALEKTLGKHLDFKAVLDVAYAAGARKSPDSTGSQQASDGAWVDATLEARIKPTQNFAIVLDASVATLAGAKEVDAKTTAPESKTAVVQAGVGCVAAF